jgi:DNA-binding NarL/FixJ family response regulator
LAVNSHRPILVVDDDAVFRSYVSELLESVGYRVEQHENGTTVLPAAEAERPALVILEVQLPGLNGYEVCRELRERYGDAIAIVFISGARTEPLDRAAGLLLGADDYVTKPVDPGELIARVRRLAERPHTNGTATSSNEKLASLTNREHEVLDLLAEGYRQEEIAGKLVISPKTVGTHIQRILGKLEVRSRAQAVSVALHRDGDVQAHGHVPLDLLV